MFHKYFHKTLLYFDALCAPDNSCHLSTNTATEDNGDSSGCQGILLCWANAGCCMVRKKVKKNRFTKSFKQTWGTRDRQMEEGICPCWWPSAVCHVLMFAWQIKAAAYRSYWKAVGPPVNKSKMINCGGKSRVGQRQRRLRPAVFRLTGPVCHIK